MVIRASLRGTALACLTCLITAACSASKTTDEFDDPDVTGRDVNPEGVPYPTDNLGGTDRAGTRRGDRIPNFTFQAYRDGNREAGLQSVSMADFFDPPSAHHKLLHIQIAATWCSVCSAVCSTTVTVKDTMASEGVVYLEVVVNGNVNAKGPAVSEVDAWIDRHHTNFTTAIDVRARRMSSIGIDGTVVPWDLLIDTRTMEILDSSGGAPANLETYDRQGLAFVNTRPPSY